MLLSVVGGGWWSEWVLWSECDVTCGDGVEVYHRQCYGDICPGGDVNYETKSVACNEEPCPGLFTFIIKPIQRL